MKRTTTALLMLAISSTAWPKPKLLEHIPLLWKSTSELRLDSVSTGIPPITIDTFTDDRDDKQAIGENREDPVVKPVTTTDDVGAFVSTHMRELFKQAGLTIVDSGGTVSIKGEVKRFFVREESTYVSNVQIHLTVVDQGGKTLWNGQASGEATRFGRSYKAENYYETLSDALVNTVSSMLQTPDFQKALAGQRVASANN